ncbi:uncharacterized protein LOC126834922 isoform X2 [Adelges cooleyi]|uniref:uncharacterized protein LOC126834922 isoform X2 n=1 Tax=Adelges cooleyi TaxID=133065 RepID=UPI0021802205|nr:uncharacterized protein LOC126834922 isoform X2 [Adelges cooleyi]
MNRRSSLNSTSDDTMSCEEEFKAFKNQLKSVQNTVEKLNGKIVDKTLCMADLTYMDNEMKLMNELEQKITSEKMKSCYVSYKSVSLRMTQESYRICSWLLEKETSEMDNKFDIDTFIDKIIESCAGKENPLLHVDYLFRDVVKNTRYFDLSVYGNIKADENETRPITLTQAKKDIRRSQKRQLEAQVTPDEVANETGDNALQQTLVRVMQCLKVAVANNGGKPVLFYMFAIDPVSLTYTVENLFHLASLVKDRLVIIERNDSTDEFTTITFMKKKKSENNDNTENKDDIISTLFTINYDLWKTYIKKYNITERMITQDN